MKPRILRALLVLGAVVSGGTPSRAAPRKLLFDQIGAALSSRDRVRLEERLQVATTRLGNPIVVVIARRLYLETASELAERMFAEAGLGEHPRSNAVLLLVAVHNHAAAIATGKGNAGIVPEIDASRITQALLRSSQSPHALPGALARAIDALVLSAEATVRRRRPLEIEDEDPPRAEKTTPDSADSRHRFAAPGLALAELGGDAGAPASIPAVASDNPGAVAPQGQDNRPGQTGNDGNDGEPEQHGKGGSLFPIGIGLAVAFVVAMALRRRQHFVSSRPTRPPERRSGPRSFLEDKRNRRNPRDR